MVLTEGPDALPQPVQPARNRAAISSSKKVSGEYATGLSKPMASLSRHAMTSAHRRCSRAELRHLKQREEALRAKLDSIVGER